MPSIEALGAHWYVSGTKAAFGLMGVEMGLPRPPRLPLPPEALGAFRTALDRFGALGRPPAAFGAPMRVAAE